MNNLFPNFNGQNFNPQPFQMNVPQKKNSNVIYSLVHGFNEAQNFMLMPGEVGLLFDSDKSEFYKKRIDDMGMTSIQKYEYKEVALPSADPPGIANTDTVLNKRMENIENALSILLQQNQPKSVEKTKEKTLFDNEEVKK